jgi:hypothetical protein
MKYYENPLTPLEYEGVSVYVGVNYKKRMSPSITPKPRHPTEIHHAKLPIPAAESASASLYHR